MTRIKRPLHNSCSKYVVTGFSFPLMGRATLINTTQSPTINQEKQSHVHQRIRTYPVRVRASLPPCSTAQQNKRRTRYPDPSTNVPLVNTPWSTLMGSFSPAPGNVSQLAAL